LGQGLWFPCPPRLLWYLLLKSHCGTMRAAYPLPTSHSFHVGMGMEPRVGSQNELLGGSCRMGIVDGMTSDNQRAALFRTPQTNFRAVSPGATAHTITQWSSSPVSNIRAFSPGAVPQLVARKNPTVFTTVQRDNSNLGGRQTTITAAPEPMVAQGPLRSRRASLPNSTAAPAGKAVALSESKGSSLGVTRLQEAARSRPLAPQLRLKNPEAIALDRNRRAATTAVTNGQIQGFNAASKARKVAVVNTPRGVSNTGSSARTTPLSRAPAGALVTARALSPSLLGSGWATTGGSGTSVVYHPILRSSADNSTTTFRCKSPVSTPVGSSNVPIAVAQTPVAVIDLDLQRSSVQDSIKRRAADLLRGAAQTGTLGIAFGAMVSETQDDAPANAGACSIDLVEPVPVQPTQPSKDAIANVVTVEVPMLPQTPTSTEATPTPSPIASAVQVSVETTQAPRSLSLEEEEEVLSPVAFGGMGDTGGAPSPSHAAQLVPQGLVQQEQPELLQKAKRPSDQSCCFGFLRRNLKKKAR